MAIPLSATETETNRRRLQFDFSQDATERLDDMVELTGASSRAEVVRRALSLLDHVLASELKGGALMMEWPDGRRDRLIIK